MNLHRSHKLRFSVTFRRLVPVPLCQYRTTFGTVLTRFVHS